MLRKSRTEEREEVRPARLRAIVAGGIPASLVISYPSLRAGIASLG